MSNPKVILLNGFAGAGKTTLARMYINDHPLAIVIEGDELIVNIGDWLNLEDKARSLVFALTKEMLNTAINLGHDVMIPKLVTNPNEVTELEQIAISGGVQFYELYLATPRNRAVQRLLERGTWGEAGVPLLKKDDTPTIMTLYEQMEAALPHRPHQISIQISERTPQDTYREMLSYIE